MPNVRPIDSFELVGGSPALDFANSITSPGGTQRDAIDSYDALLRWAGRAGILSRAEGATLAERARLDPTRAANVVRSAQRKRRAIIEVFSAIAANRPPPKTMVRRVLAAYGAAVANAEATPDDTGARLTWLSDDLVAPLRIVDYDAGRLFLSGETSLVKECETCPWLFLDRSRNHSRRWCDMQVCGSRAKMRRYLGARRSVATKPAGRTR